MEIRDAKRSDWPAIQALVRSAYHENYPATGEIYLGIEGLGEKIEALREEFDAIGSRFLVAFEDLPPRGEGSRPEGGEVMGEGRRAIGAILVRLREPGRAWIDDLFVAPEARRKGIAAELVSAAVPPRAEVGCEVNCKNDASLELFQSLGFERVVETVVFRRRAQG